MLLGRWAFWPFRPMYGSEHTDTKGLWGRLARLVQARHRVVWVSTFLALAASAAFITQLDEDQVPQTELFLTEVESVTAQEVIDAHYEADNASPAQVVVPEEDLDATVELLAGHPGIAQPAADAPGQPSQPAVFPLPSEDDPREPKIVDGQAIVFATLADPADSQAATDTVRDLRTDLDEVSEDVLVGGSTAINLDTRDVTGSDRAKVIPAILLVIFVVLALLLRALLAPVLLIGANVLSFGAALGSSAAGLRVRLRLRGRGPLDSLIGFVFLVALGIDYTIFLMTRVREEAIRHGTRAGILKRPRGDRRRHHLRRHRARGDVRRARGGAAGLPGPDRLHRRVRRAARHARRALAAGAGAGVRHRARHLVALEAVAGDRPRRRRDRADARRGRNGGRRDRR